MLSSDSASSDSAWLQHAQILDSALPIGAFSHSFGLETLIHDGRVNNAAELKQFLQSALRGAWGSADVLLIKGVYVLSELEIWKLDALQDAGRVSRETREGMRKMGRQALKLAKAIHPQLNFSPLQEAIALNFCPGTWPLVYGLWTRELGLPLDRAAHGYLYGCCAAAVGNSVRLSLVGQTAAQSLLAQLMPDIASAWEQAVDRDPLDFCTSLPILEIAQLRHESLDARLFMS